MKIRWKLFVAFVLVVSGGTLGTLLVAEHEFRDWVRAQVKESFERHVEQILVAREDRLAEVRAQSKRLAGHEVVHRVLAGSAQRVQASDLAALRLTYARDRLVERPGMLADRDRSRDGRWIDEDGPAMPLPLMGVLTRDRRTILFSNHRLRLDQRRSRASASWSRPHEELERLQGSRSQVVGYGLLDEALLGDRVKEVVVTPVEIDGEWAGWFFLGRDARTQEERVLSRLGVMNSWTGVWVDGEWFAAGVDEGLKETVQSLVTPALLAKGEPEILEWGGGRYLLVARVLNPESPLGQGAQIAVFDLSRLEDAVEELRWAVVLLGLTVVLISIVVALALSRRFSLPILRLVEATRKVREGDLGWQVPVKGKDEFAVLADDFNRMTRDLSLKEKYRDLLGKTSDPSVAERLVEGSLELGGELRHATVVFCDIRGFTTMTDGMAPAAVIAMLNDHMTAMTQVIHEHGGVVDKFVGDMVMAVFGAPVARADDTERAARCAIAMVRVRNEMNTTMEVPVEIGLGLATGEIVSGLMGSEDRLNYTVLGDRVNLAARLCSLAGEGEVLVDGHTMGVLPEELRGKPHGSVEVRGFRAEVEIWSLATEGGPGESGSV